MIGFADGTNVMQKELVAKKEDSSNLGLDMAKLMIENGALELLKKAEEIAFKDEMPQRL